MITSAAGFLNLLFTLVRDFVFDFLHLCPRGWLAIDLAITQRYAARGEAGLKVVVTLASSAAVCVLTATVDGANIPCCCNISRHEFKDTWIHMFKLCLNMNFKSSSVT